MADVHSSDKKDEETAARIQVLEAEIARLDVQIKEWAEQRAEKEQELCILQGLDYETATHFQCRLKGHIISRRRDPGAVVNNDCPRCKDPSPLRPVYLFTMVALVMLWNVTKNLGAAFAYALSTQEVLKYTNLVQSPPALLVFVLGACFVVFVVELTKMKDIEQFAKGSANYPPLRFVVVGRLLFLTLVVLLNSPLLVTAFTGVDMWGRFFVGYKEHTYTMSTGYVITQDLLINLIIAALATGMYIAIYVAYSKGYPNLGDMPLMKSTIILASVPLLVAYLPIALLAQAGSQLFYMVLFFAAAGAFLALLGYSHPRNRLDAFSAKVLFFGCIASVFIGLILAVYSLNQLIARQTDEARAVATQVPGEKRSVEEWERWSNLVGWRHDIDWAAMERMKGYPRSHYLYRDLRGFVWTVLTDMIYLCLVLAVFVVLTVYHYQIIPALAEATAGEAGTGR